jgi:tRNA A37 methylthiotransferase MiaB
LVEEVRPDVTNVSKFFPRPGTPASEMSGRVPSSEVKARSARLASLARRISSECNRGWVGWSGKVLVDEAGKGESVVGRNFAYKPVVIQDGGQGLLGEFVDVKVVGAFQSYLLGEIS